MCSSATLAPVRAKRRFGAVLPVRLPHDVNDRLGFIAVAAGLSKSDAMRLAIAHGLPALERGEIVLSRCSVSIGAEESANAKLG